MSQNVKRTVWGSGITNTCLRALMTACGPAPAVRDWPVGSPEQLRQPAELPW